MAKIMVIGRYPPTKFKEMTALFMSSDKPKYPDFVKKLHNWVAQSHGSKYKVYAVYECPNDKVMESLTALTRRYHFYASLEGYEYSVEILMDMSEAIKIGMG